MSLLLDPVYLRNSEIGQFILPFFLMFAIVYGIMNYTNPFGKQKNVNALISAVLGLFAAASGDFVSFFWNNLNLILVLFIILFILLIAKKLSEGEEADKGGLALLAMGIILIIAAKGNQIIDGVLGIDRNSAIFLIVIALFAVLIFAKSK